MVLIFCLIPNEIWVQYISTEPNFSYEKNFKFIFPKRYISDGQYPVHHNGLHSGSHEQ